MLAAATVLIWGSLKYILAVTVTNASLTIKKPDIAKQNHSFLPVSSVCSCFYYIIFSMTSQLCGVALKRIIIKKKMLYLTEMDKYSIYDFLKNTFRFFYYSVSA